MDSEDQTLLVLVVIKGFVTHAVVIFHHLSTIRNAGLICVVEDGRKVEQGMRNDLLEQNELHAHLNYWQFKDLAA